METQKGGKHVRKSRRCGGQVRSSSIPLIDVLKEKRQRMGQRQYWKELWLILEFMKDTNSQSSEERTDFSVNCSMNLDPSLIPHKEISSRQVVAVPI